MKLTLLIIIGSFILISCSPYRMVNGRGYKTSTKIEKDESKSFVTKNERQEIKNNSYKSVVTKEVSEDLEFEMSVNLSEHPYAPIASSTNNDYYENPTTRGKKAFLDYNQGTKTMLIKSQFNPKSTSYFIPKLKEIKSDTTFSESPVEGKKVIDPISIISLAFVPIGAITVFLSIVFINVYLVYPLFFFVGFAFLIMAFILGIVSLMRMRNKPDKYKGKGFALAGFIGGLIGTSFFLLIVIIIVLFMI